MSKPPPLNDLDDSFLNVSRQQLGQFCWRAGHCENGLFLSPEVRAFQWTALYHWTWANDRVRIDAACDLPISRLEPLRITTVKLALPCFQKAVVCRLRKWARFRWDRICAKLWHWLIVGTDASLTTWKQRMTRTGCCSGCRRSTLNLTPTLLLLFARYY